MTTLAHRSTLRGPSSGGLAARRPLVRWAWRLFRREWRQQILVIALVTVAVAAAACGITIAYNSGPLDYAEFGSGNARFELDAADPGKLEASLAAAEERFGTIDVIAHRSLPVPGSVDTLEFRAQDPRGSYARLTLRRGSYPEGPARSPSPTEWRPSSGSRSGTLSPSTAVAERSSASSRTHLS
jgi:putative ABC transport system permease protein